MFIKRILITATLSVTALIGFLSFSDTADIKASLAAPKPTPVKPAAVKPTPSILNQNLIKDGNAENNAVKAWSSKDELKTLIYGEFGGGPYPDSPGPANRGERYLYTKITSEHPSAVFSETVSVAQIQKYIDAETVKYDLHGWFGGVNTSFSSARLKVGFLDAAGKSLLSDETEEVKESDRADDLVLIERSRAGSVPKGTVQIKIELEFYIRKGHEGENIDTNAYADNLSLILTSKP